MSPRRPGCSVGRTRCAAPSSAASSADARSASPPRICHPKLEGFIPADGVYAGLLTVDGHKLPAAISVGNNPTFDGVPERQVEAHVLDRDLDLYGKTVEVSFVSRIRGMEKFAGIDALVAQIGRDVAQVRALLPGGARHERAPMTSRRRTAWPMPLWAGRTMALVGILLVALNLRTAVASISPIAAEIAADIPLSAVGLGLIGMVPPVAFAASGFVAAPAARKYGLERVLILAIRRDGRRTVGARGRRKTTRCCWPATSSR